MLAAPISIHPVIGFTAILCIALGAGASGALNQWYEADLDAKMKRTQSRPLPAGRMDRQSALHFGVGVAALSVILMGLAVNYVAAGILLISILFYVFIYTVWLKRRTPQNIVIGGAAGAFPPLIGWAAATGEIALLPVLLFGLVFLWTPPHFWALALFVKTDYANAGVPMLPVVAALHDSDGGGGDRPLAARADRQPLWLDLDRHDRAVRPARAPRRDPHGERRRRDEARKAAVRLFDLLPLHLVRRGCRR